MELDMGSLRGPDHMGEDLDSPLGWRFRVPFHILLTDATPQVQTALPRPRSRAHLFLFCFDSCLCVVVFVCFEFFVWFILFVFFFGSFIDIFLCVCVFVLPFSGGSFFCVFCFVLRCQSARVPM